MSALNKQLELFTMDAVLAVYYEAGGEEVSNQDLYAQVAERLKVPDAIHRKTPVGKAGAKRSLATRKIRWMQQTARALGLLERVPGKRGKWRYTGADVEKKGEAVRGRALIAFSTRLGIAIWAHWEDVLPRLDTPINLVVTSPPYLLARQRAYGGISDEKEYVDFIVRAIEPVVSTLAPGGSICLNLGNNCFEPGSPARRLYQQRLVLALHDELGLSLMDNIIWFNTSAPPSPMQWASKTRQQLIGSYESVYWFTNDPTKCTSDNRRVLEPHTARHKALIEQGGEKRTATFSDGAYRIQPGSFGNQTEGKIPRNVWPIGHRDSGAIACNAFAKENGYQTHGAPMPLTLADRLVRFLSAPGALVVDMFAGRLTTAKAAENNGRRWIAIERIADHIEVARQVRFPCSTTTDEALGRG